jgi:heme exporter protein B
MLFFGSMGIAVLFSLVTAIAYKANRNMTLAAILSLPLVLPLLVLLIAGTKVSIDDLGWTIYQDYLLSIVALDVILVILAYLLFPYLWRE